MDNILIFSGTTEGRTLSDMLSNSKIKHIVCVASEYGMEVMKGNEYASIRVGRMDADEMISFFKSGCLGGGIIVDATHPYATVVTENIKQATHTCEMKYIRVIRDRSEMEGRIYNNIEEMAGGIAKLLKTDDERMMLTTGSKDLPKICSKLNENQKRNLFVRVLPATESINICLENGIEPGHIIAMQGPFSKEMNVALMKQYDIRHLVTKESGAAGGFDEKISAARELGVTCHIVARNEESGLHVEEAYREITGEEYNQPESLSGEAYIKKEQAVKQRVTLIGRGMGTLSTMTIEAAQAIAKADAVFGATRLISDIECNKKYEMYRAEDIIPVLKNDNTIQNAAVIFSGDSGFYSGATAMKGKMDGIAEVDIMCGISSVSYFSSKLGKAYSDACICSLHGRNDFVNINQTVDKILNNKRTFILLSGAEDVRTLGEKLADEEGISIIVGTNLSYEDEAIEVLTPNQAREFERSGVMLCCVENEMLKKQPVINVLEDSAFIREKVPMTKECVRHESIIALKLKKGDVVYDIGGGTGSIAIEISKLDPGLKVYTVEKKAEAISLIEKNMKKLGAESINLVKGEAPGALAHLEPCDAVFIGGSSGNMAEILQCIRYRKSGVRVVINAVSFETISEVNELLKTLDIEDVRIMQLAVTDVKEIGNYHMMQANNPVMIYSFTMK